MRYFCLSGRGRPSCRSFLALEGLVALLLLLFPATAGDSGGKVEYVGGTLEEFREGAEGRLLTVNDQFLVFDSKGGHYLVPWESINLLEYGQKVSRRYMMAVLISPLLVMSKSRKHFLSIGFSDDRGHQQAMIFRVAKKDVRELLVCLEVKANMQVVYQDEEARKAGKG